VENDKLRSDEAARSKSSVSGRAGAMGVMTKFETVEDEQGKNSDLMDVIASMRSRLDEWE
jgi:hypothetical protein